MKTVVGVFDSFQEAEDAVADLGNVGILHSDISLIGNNAEGRYDPYIRSAAHVHEDNVAVGTDAATGAVVGGFAGLLVGMGVIAIPGLGPIVAAGWLVATLTGAGVGAAVGGLTGALTHAGVPQDDANLYNESVQRGGTLVAVKAEEIRALEVARLLAHHGAINVEERALQYREQSYPIVPMPVAVAEPIPLTAPDPIPVPSPVMVPLPVVDVSPVGDEHLRRNAGYATWEPDFQNNFRSNFATSGLTYEQLRPAYDYGVGLADDPQYRDQEWSSVEPQIRQNWEARQPGTWNQFQNAIRFAWDKATGAERGGIQTGGYATDGTPDTRGISEKISDAITGDHIDDKTGKIV